MTKLRSLFSTHPQRREALTLYIALARASRNPFFYTQCSVPDTLDGRFDMLLLHIFLALREDPRPEQVRLLLECFVNDMDRSLRELGVGDMGVGKRVKVMTKAAYGRLKAYGDAYASDAELELALIRNLYRGNAPSAAAVASLMRYLREYSGPEATIPLPGGSPQG